METLWLRLRAPFAAFRGLQAGVYRTTAPVIPPSAAWGLVLNLAGIETRLGGDVVTGVDPRAPALCLAVGAVTFGEVSTLYQQLHSYPVGNSGKDDLKPKAKGSKFWITPVRREVLVGFDCVLGVRAEERSLYERVGRGLRGELEGARYGVPFAGDNNLLFDRIEVLDAPIEAHWYARLGPDTPARRHSCRLTVGIDRADSSRTTTMLAAPLEHRQAQPPEAAWFWTPRPPAGVP
jgi:CRISPR-associated protein Cas5t